MTTVAPKKQLAMSGGIRLPEFAWQSFCYVELARYFREFVEVVSSLCHSHMILT